MTYINRSEFGTNSFGEKIYSFKLKNNQGTTIHCLNYGASIQKFLCLNKNGNCDDLVLGFDSILGYESKANQNFGGTIGRVAGRIEKACFNLNDKHYKLAKNWKQHHLHGGSSRPLDRVIWDAHNASERDISRIKFIYSSPDGEEGYPGNLSIQITYSLNSDNELIIDFDATSDQETPLNLTNHSYWNLKGAGNGNIFDHKLEIKNCGYLECNDELIPTGKITFPTKEDPLNFSVRKKIGSDFEKIVARYPQYKGIDHTFILDPKSSEHVSLSESTSGRSLKINTSLPCIQVYSGNHLFKQKGKNNFIYNPFGGIALECQLYPNAVNQSKFPSCILRPEKPYKHFIKFGISTNRVV
ncbi:MAG: aldose epimerase family protein [Oligoflexales bacterium]